MNIVKSREVKTFSRVFTGAFTTPHEITFHYYWKDENSVALIMKPWGPYPQNSVNVLQSTQPFPTDLIPIKEYHGTYMGIMDNVTQGSGSLVVNPTGILINTGQAPFTFSGVDTLSTISQAETTLYLV